MDRLWAPWRSLYLQSAKGPIEDFITDADQSTADQENLVITRTELSIVMLNRYPYNNGHLLIAPRRAVADLTDLTDGELLDAQKTLTQMMTAQRQFLRPAGFNVGLNLGRDAGAGLPGHLHWHLVPRWAGDTNFMSAVCDARVLSQSLDESWRQHRLALGLPTPG